MRKLMLIACLLLALVAALSPTPTRAQHDPATVWYWATTPDGLVAYTVDGDMSLLIEDRTLNGNTSFYGYRLTSDAALFLTATDFYWVKGTHADTFPIDPFIPQNYMQPVDFSWPYVLFRDPEIVRPAALVNLETKSMEILSGNFIGPGRFVSEVATFRYISSDVLEYSKRQVTLWERDLATGEERPLIVGQFDAALSSPDGLMWWWLSGYDNASGRYSEVQVVGDISMLPSEHLQWLVDNDATVIGAYLHHRLDHQCETDCVMVAYPLAGGQSITYHSQGSAFPYYFYYFADETALVSSPLPNRFVRASSVKLFDSNGAILLDLGQSMLFDFEEYIITSIDGLHDFSADGRWAVSLEISDHHESPVDVWPVPAEYEGTVDWPGQLTLLLWYLPYRGIVYRGAFQRQAGASFNGDTALVGTDLYAPVLAWRTNIYEDTVVKTIVLDDYRGQFYTPISGGRAIYRSPEGDLMLFSMQDFSFSLLVPQAKPIPIYE